MDQPRKILLVEDNETHAHLILRHLRKSTSKIQVEQATTITDALGKLEEIEFDAVLLDLSLPDSPIHETLEKVIPHTTAVPVIVLTSLNDVDFANKAVQQGAQDYLVKTDLDTAGLERAIRYAIERKRAQGQLQSYADELEESNKHLQSFAHTLAHEVRSPLTVVSGSLQIIQQKYAGKIDPDTLGLVENSLTAISGMTELIESLLEFSQASDHDGSFGPVELEALLFHVHAIVKPLLDEVEGKLVYEALPTVHGNEVQLRQLMQNLIVNAVKYRREEKLVVQVSCVAQESGWVLSVRDNGRGIAPRDQEKIFDAFTRLDDTSHISGVGIGLAFCKRIADNHQGNISVESELGVGSQFNLELPKRAVGEDTSG